MGRASLLSNITAVIPLESFILEIFALIFLCGAWSVEFYAFEYDQTWNSKVRPWIKESNNGTNGTNTNTTTTTKTPKFGSGTNWTTTTTMAMSTTEGLVGRSEESDGNNETGSGAENLKKFIVSDYEGRAKDQYKYLHGNVLECLFLAGVGVILVGLIVHLAVPMITAKAGNKRAFVGGLVVLGGMAILAGFMVLISATLTRNRLSQDSEKADDGCGWCSFAANSSSTTSKPKPSAGKKEAETEKGNGSKGGGCEDKWGEYEDLHYCQKYNMKLLAWTFSLASGILLMFNACILNGLSEFEDYDEAVDVEEILPTRPGWYRRATVSRGRRKTRPLDNDRDHPAAPTDPEDTEDDDYESAFDESSASIASHQSDNDSIKSNH